MVNLMEKEFIFILMDLIIKEISLMDCMKDKVYFGIKRMDLHIKVNGKQENPMEMVNRHSQGLESMKVALLMDLNKETEK
jgi:hypothetical protein